MQFYNDIDETKIKKKQIIDDWQELFPTFTKRKAGKSIIFSQVNLPVIKDACLGFYRSNWYEPDVVITSLFKGVSILSRESVETKKHYLIISRGIYEERTNEVKNMENIDPFFNI